MEFSHDMADALVRSAEQHPVNFDDAWQWIGYFSKQKAKNKLIGNFEEGIDYVLLTQMDKQKSGKGGHNREIIMLTVDCFKAFCMMAGTERGKEVRRYFLNIEKKWQSQLQPNPTSTQLTPSLLAQLCNGNAQLEWVLSQCHLTPNGCDLQIDFPSRDLHDFFDQLLDLFLESAHNLGIVESYVYVAGEWKARYPVAAMLGWDRWVQAGGANNNA